MQIEVNGKIYNTKYFPFFRIRRSKTFDVFIIRYPSGATEELMVFDTKNYMKELKEYLKYLIQEYMYEDDLMLTVFAKRLKRDVNDLFAEERR
jgi:hypothetical protein